MSVTFSEEFDSVVESVVGMSVRSVLQIKINDSPFFQGLASWQLNIETVY